MKQLTLILLPLLIALSGCTSISTRQNVLDPEYDFSKYRTFDILPVQYDKTNEVAMKVLGYDDISAVALRAVLEAKGFVYAEGELPDFMVRFGVEAEVKKPGGNSELENNPLVSYATARAPRSVSGTELSDMETSQQIRGVREISGPTGVYYSMRVDIFDTRTKKLLWKGWATSSTIEAFRGDRSKMKIINEIMFPFPN